MLHRSVLLCFALVLSCVLIQAQDCGKLPSRRRRTIGGDIIRGCDWPWLAFVRVTFTIPGAGITRAENLGTAVLIGNDTVVVSGLVVEEYKGLEAGGLNPIVTVTVGESDTRRRDKAEETFGIVDTFLAPSFNSSGSFTRDNLGVLKLNGTVTRGKCVQPACLANSTNGLRNCRLIGWGQMPKTNISSFSRLPLTTDTMTIMDTAACTSRYHDLPQNDLCVFGNKRSGDGRIIACDNDIGNMLMCETTTNGNWVLRGIVSKGNCDNHLDPIVLADIANHRSWLQNPV